MLFALFFGASEYKIHIMVTNFFLPEFYGNFKMIIFLHDLMESHPEYFYEDIRIAAAYGCFPGNIWNGGRVIIGSASKEDIDFAIKEYNDRGIAIRFTFTNPRLETIHLLDTYCNLCMREAHNGKNEVLVNSPLLEKFLKDNYPDYKYISSTTKCLGSAKMLRKELEKDYYLVVLDSAMNNTDELFALDHRDRMELIVDHFCQDNCPRRKTHYNILGKSQMEFSTPPADFTCKNIDREFFQIMENRSFISTDLIFGKYKDAGFRHFKLDGRSYLPHRLIASFLYYLVKPEWHNQMWQVILREVYKL